MNFYNDYDDDYEPDELTPAERRALFVIRRLDIEQARMVAGVFVYRRANKSYRVGSVLSPRRGTLADIQLWAAREVVRQTGEKVA